MSAQYPDLSLTNFPNSVDQFMTFLNIVATDGPLIAQYQQAMESGNSVLANQILSQIPAGTQKIITATTLNKLSEAILAIERFYKTDIQPYVNNLQTSWMNIINRFAYCGQWNSGTSYEANNMVSYTVSGVELVYIAILPPPTGTVPVNNSYYWRLLTIQGQQGVSGDGLSYRQTWVNSTQYYINDVVTYSGALWMATQPNQNQAPSSNSNVWSLILNLEATTYPIQNTQPDNLNTGDLWFKTGDSLLNYAYLPPLTNPAGPQNIAAGFQAYDASGNLIVGTA